MRRTTLAITFLLFVIAILSAGCSHPPRQPRVQPTIVNTYDPSDLLDDPSIVDTGPEIGIPDKPKPVWRGTLNTTATYPMRRVGSGEWILVGQDLRWAKVTRTHEITKLVGHKGTSILIPLAFSSDSLATQDLQFQRDWKGRVDYRWTRR